MTMPSLKTRPAVSDGLDVVDGLDVAVAVVDVVGPTSRARKNRAEIHTLPTDAPFIPASIRKTIPKTTKRNREEIPL